MKDEIKEILEYLKCEEEYYDGIEEVVLSSDEKVIERDDIELLLDYITNLQTIEREYSAILSENAELENKITNLQEENERLKEENKHIFANVNDDQLLRSNAMNYAELQDYKTRNEKAIEKCKNKQYETNAPWLIKFANKRTTRFTNSYR